MPRTSAMLETVPAAAAGLVTVEGKTFPLREAALRVRAGGGIAASRLIQTYDNPYEEPLEVLYTMPLPADGSVIGYTVHLGGRIIVGEIEKRDAARERYRRALEEGRTAGLLEQERADTFTQTLGNLPPGEVARVEIEVLQPLPFRPGAGEAPGEWEYRFPTVVGVRYQGEPGRVPDRDRLDAPRTGDAGTPARLELDLHIADGAPDGIVPSSSTHELYLEPGAAGTRLSLKEKTRLDRDVVIRWRATGPEVGITLREGRGLQGDDGRYGLLTITPPTAPRETFDRDLTILIDASGSMSGGPIRTAKTMAASLLESLGPDDRFELLAFSMDVERLVDGPLEATRDNIGDALGRLEGLEAGGGTEMTRAIVGALQPLRPDSQRQVVLLTDGYIGFEPAVVGEIRDRLPGGARLHTVGIGSAPNRSLTRHAARAGRGVELAVFRQEEVRSACERLVRATAGPVLTDLRIDGSAVKAFAPARLRDVLEGQPVVVPVELRRAGGTLEVAGRLAGTSRTWSQKIAVGPGQPAATDSGAVGAGSGVDPVPFGALFGREAIDDCEMDLAVADDRRKGRKITDRIEALGLRHRITSRRTSLIAVSEDPTVNPNDPRRRRRLEAELPAGVSAEGVGLAPGKVFEQRVLGPMPLGYLGMGAFDRSMSREAFEELAEMDIEAREMVGAPRPAAPRMRSWWQFFRPGFRRDRMPVARLIRREGELLVIEFESPEDGFVLPAALDRIVIQRRDEPEMTLRLDERLTTRPGPHPAGVTLRIAVRIAAGETWKTGRAIIAWGKNGKEMPRVLVEVT